MRRVCVPETKKPEHIRQFCRPSRVGGIFAFGDQSAEGEFGELLEPATPPAPASPVGLSSIMPLSR